MLDRKPIRVMAIDPHPIVLAGLRSIVDQEPDMVFVGMATDPGEGTRKARSLRPGVVVMEIGLSVGGAPATQGILAMDAPPRVLLLTGRMGDSTMALWVDLATHGFLLKTVSIEGLVQAIRTIGRGGSANDVELVTMLMKKRSAVRNEHMKTPMIGSMDEPVPDLRRVRFRTDKPGILPGFLRKDEKIHSIECWFYLSHN